MGYTIERQRVTPAGNVCYELVRDDLQRITVAIPRKFASGDQVDTIITAALDNLLPPAKPF